MLLASKSSINRVLNVWRVRAPGVAHLVKKPMRAAANANEKSHSSPNNGKFSTADIRVPLTRTSTSPTNLTIDFSPCSDENTCSDCASSRPKKTSSIRQPLVNVLPRLPRPSSVPNLISTSDTSVPAPTANPVAGSLSDRDDPLIKYMQNRFSSLRAEMGALRTSVGRLAADNALLKAKIDATDNGLKLMNAEFEILNNEVLTQEDAESLVGAFAQAVPIKPIGKLPTAEVRVPFCRDSSGPTDITIQITSWLCRASSPKFISVRLDNFSDIKQRSGDVPSSQGTCREQNLLPCASPTTVPADTSVNASDRAVLKKYMLKRLGSLCAEMEALRKGVGAKMIAVSSQLNAEMDARDEAFCSFVNAEVKSLNDKIWTRDDADLLINAFTGDVALSYGASQGSTSAD